MRFKVTYWSGSSEIVEGESWSEIVASNPLLSNLISRKRVKSVKRDWNAPSIDIHVSNTELRNKVSVLESDFKIVSDTANLYRCQRDELRAENAELRKALEIVRNHQ